MKRKVILLTSFICCYGILKAQIGDKQLFPTANAAAGSYSSQIPVDFFTGIPNITIPVYQFKSRDLSLPVSLAYYAAGVKPSDHASWVGLGWSLLAGGVITRIQNDLPDELVDYSFTTPIRRGFLYNSTYLGANWHAYDSLESAEVQELNQVEYPTTLSTHTRVDFAPDYFQFDFLGMSGSLIFGQDEAWHLQSKQGLNFNVTQVVGPYAVWEPSPNPNLPKNTPSLIQTCLTGFILTGADGTQYIFGAHPATYTNNFISSASYGYFSNADSSAVEFSRVGTGYGSGATQRDGGTVPVSWYLSKILSPTGDSITFHYTRDGYQVIANTVTYGSFSQLSGTSPQEYYTYGAGDNVYVLDGITLSTITGANGSIQCKKSKANVLDYSLLGSPSSPPNQDWNNGQTGLCDAYRYEIFQGDSIPTHPASTFMELDTLIVSNSAGTRIRSFQFKYTSGATNRLFLNSIQPFGADGSSTPPYTFTYDNIGGLNNVPYNTLDVDHWGFYNAVNPFTGMFTSTTMPTTLNPITNTGYTYDTTISISGTTYHSSFDSAFNAVYTANRTPVNGPMQYGVLTGITYPSGGNTQFAWEPDTYSKCLNEAVTNPAIGVAISVQDLGTTITGGGLRIHQISSRPNFNSPLVTKTYYYCRDYIHNNLTSSGVLNGAQPLYVDTFSFSTNFLYRGWSGNTVLPMNPYNGNPVTYTNVTELNADGGFNIYTYSNEDNGHLDSIDENYLNNSYGYSGPYMREISASPMDLERGLLLNESTYRPGPVLLKNTAYQYNSDTTRYNNSIHMYQYKMKFALGGQSLGYDGGGFLTSSNQGPSYYGDLLMPMSIFVDYPYLQNVTQTEYDQNGLNPLATVTNYSYDIYRNKKTERHIGSKGEVIVDSANYAWDYISGTSTPTQEAKTNMISAGMIGIPLEKIRTVNGVQTSHYRMDYQMYEPENYIIVPAYTYQSSYGAALDTQARYSNYDNLGNILMLTDKTGVPVSFDWGYNQSYPIVRISNALNNYPTSKNYFYDGFEEATPPSMISGAAHTGTYYFGGATYTAAFTPPDNNNYIIEWWNLNNGVWNYNKQAYTTGMTLTGPVDDVRIFPRNALMTTYTYQPLVGVSSEIDPKGFTTYYTYDDLGRLSVVRDKDGNILKTIQYHYQGQ